MKLVAYIILACVCNTLFRYHPFNFQFGVPEQYHTSYAVGQACSYVLLLLSINYLWSIRPLHHIQNIYKRLYPIVFWSSLSNLADELFFDPLRLQWNEVAFVILIIINFCFADKIKKLLNRLTTWKIFQTKMRS